MQHVYTELIWSDALMGFGLPCHWNVTWVQTWLCKKWKSFSHACALHVLLQKKICNYIRTVLYHVFLQFLVKLYFFLSWFNSVTGFCVYKDVTAISQHCALVY